MSLKNWLKTGSLKRKFAESDGKHGQNIKIYFPHLSSPTIPDLGQAHKYGVELVFWMLILISNQSEINMHIYKNKQS